MKGRDSTIACRALTEPREHPLGDPDSMNPIYLDNNATTRTDPRVVDAMLPYFNEIYGNASSSAHRFGWEASDAVERSRAQVAAAIGAEPRDILFTSGATESNNLAIKGVAHAYARRGKHLVTSTVEHAAVLDPMKRLAREGWSLTLVACDASGQVSPEVVEAALTDETALVSVIAANNEVGTLNDITSIGQVCHARGVIFHTDAAQSVGKIPTDVSQSSIDLLSLSAHKFYGPKGIGALYVRRREPRVRLLPLFDGGGQERGLRSGTLPVPLIVGMGVAAELAAGELETESARLTKLRQALYEGIIARVPQVRLNGHPADRLPGNLNLSFRGVDGQAIMMAMRQLAVSSGAACSSVDPEPSHVLLAMGLDEDIARSSLRFGLGRFTTLEEIDRAVDIVATTVDNLRSKSAAWLFSSDVPVDIRV
jgi:cysteine desulfurase